MFIDREFEEICEEGSMADKLQTLDVMCAEQGFLDGSAGEEALYVLVLLNEAVDAQFCASLSMEKREIHCSVLD